MNERAVMKSIIHITNVIHTGTAFAVTEDGQAVFVPKSVADTAKVKIGDEVEARLVANHQDPKQRTPLMAVYIEPGSEKPKPAARPMAEEVINILGDGYMTTAEVGDDLGIDSQSASAILNEMHAQGKIAKAAVWAKPNQQKASVLLWAKDMAGFVGGEE